MAFYDGLILWLIHTILHIKSLIYTWLYRSWKPVDSQYRKVAYSRCCNDSKSLQKLPIHLGLVIVENQISYADIASVIVWSMAIGISYISVYDSRGILKKSQSSLNRQIEKKHTELFGHDKTKHTFKLFHPQASTVPEISESKHRSHILLLSAQDGRADIVNAARGYCQQVHDQLNKSSTVDVTHIEALLQATSGFPDPDLVIRFGTTCSLMGYLPWQIRLTEILSIPTHWNVDYKSFIATLHNYAGTHQRFGK